MNGHAALSSNENASHIWSYLHGVNHEVRMYQKLLKLPVFWKRVPGQTLSFSFYSENLSSVIPLFSYFHFTLNKYEESYIPKQNKGTEWAHQNTSGQKLHFRRLHVKWQWDSLMLKKQCNSSALRFLNLFAKSAFAHPYHLIAGRLWCFSEIALLWCWLEKTPPHGCTQSPSIKWDI